VRAEGMNRYVVQKFLHLVEEITKELGIQENNDKFFNVDKTGLPTNNYPEKNLFSKRRKMRINIKDNYCRTWQGHKGCWLL
jgi:hypothetical protein